MSDELRSEIQKLLQNAFEKNEFRQCVDEQTLNADDNSAIPDTLYHYTDLKGLEGILKSKSLWATHISQLNDPLEATAGCRYFGDACYWANQTPLYLEDVLVGLRDKFYSSAPPDSFCICFSQLEDDLSQYREYADACRGYCIGFDGKKLRKNINRAIGSDDAFQFQRMLYLTYGKMAELASCLSEVCNAVIEWYRLDSDPPANSHEIEGALRDVLSSFGERLARRGKQACFGAEQELRLISAHAQASIYESMKRYRIRGSEVVSYLDVPIAARKGDLPITHIYPGPANSFDEAKRGIEVLLQACGMHHSKIDIKESWIRVRRTH